MSVPNDPLVSVTEGATKAFLGYSEEKLKQLAAKFQNKELDFVEDPETISVAKEQRGSAEYSFLKNYTDEEAFRILFQMGLTLRKMERQQERIVSLRNKILSKYDVKGLHIAQLVQNGFFNRYLASILERSRTPAQLKLEIKTLLDDIENSVVFVKETDNADFMTQAIIVRLLANSPKTFILCACGYAIQRCRDIESLLKKWLRTGTLRYEFESNRSKYREVFFLIKIEE